LPNSDRGKKEAVNFDVFFELASFLQTERAMGINPTPFNVNLNNPTNKNKIAPSQYIFIVTCRSIANGKR
jgi:hypothetical protein